MTDINVLITGGGTGGHLYPAVAVIEDLQKRYPEASILFAGSRRGSGSRIIAGLGVEFHSIRARGLTEGSNILKRSINYIMFFLDLIPGFIKSVYLLKKKNIGIVLGMGGYICAPLLLAAIVCRINFALHEQNFIPGRLNRLFSARAKYFFTSFEATKKYFKGKKVNIVYTGNPVRKRIRMAKKLDPDYGKWGLSEGKFTITAFGGSQGARRINETVIGLCDIRGFGSGIQVLLIAGSGLYEEIRNRLEGMDFRGDVQIRIFPYIDNIEEVYRITDLVLARAGANTVFETAAAGIPSILVPYPFAIDDHQSYNARYLEKTGFSVLIEDNRLEPGLLAIKIMELLNHDRKIYKRMKRVRLKINSFDSAGMISNRLTEEIFENRT